MPPSRSDIFKQIEQATRPVSDVSKRIEQAMRPLHDILERAIHDIRSSQDFPSLDQIKAIYLGKKGQLTDLLKSISQLNPAERPKLGAEINRAKDQLETIINEQKNQLQRQELERSLQAESVDITLPGCGYEGGSIHPLTLAMERLVNIFSTMGFEVADGPEIEDDFHNFDALNIPPHHPARSQQDTFYFEDGSSLRTQTSCVQIRYMETHKPPLRMIAPGKVFRRDFDATHTPMFYQIEGLVIDKKVTLAHLKSVLLEFMKAFFEMDDIELRLRPSYFPFTEPSAEMDVWFSKKNRWLEMGGCGMVHPNVLRSVGIDPKEYSGYAFGFGYGRMAMLYYGCTDLRSFFENDLRFLKQFK